jgi:hypothetical protein
MSKRFLEFGVLLVLASVARADDKPAPFSAGSYILGFGVAPLTGKNLVNVQKPFHLQPGQFILSGGPDPTDRLIVDDDIEIQLGDRKLFIDDDHVRTGDGRAANRCTYDGEPIILALPPTAKLRIRAIDCFPTDAILGDIYLHRFDGAKVLVAKAVHQRSAAKLPNVFFDQEFDLARLFSDAQPAAPSRASNEQIQSDWNQLASPNVDTAYFAMWRLIGSPEQSIALIKSQVKPINAADPKRILQLIADLDSPKFRVREKASQNLADKGKLAKPAMREASNNNASAEVRKRIETLLQRLHDAAYPPDTIRAMRGIEVLERIGSAPAKEMLVSLTNGAPEAIQTRLAREALARLPK